VEDAGGSRFLFALLAVALFCGVLYVANPARFRIKPELRARLVLDRPTVWPVRPVPSRRSAQCLDRNEDSASMSEAVYLARVLVPTHCHKWR
jgi:hypothetical protein